MFSIGLMFALAQAAVSPRPNARDIAAVRAAGCEGCSPDSWQFRNAKWYWWTGQRFTHYWHAEKIVRLAGVPVREKKPTRPPTLSIKLKPSPNVFPNRAQ